MIVMVARKERPVDIPNDNDDDDGGFDDEKDNDYNGFNDDGNDHGDEQEKYRKMHPDIDIHILHI
jgi:hypothetical protein